MSHYYNAAGQRFDLPERPLEPPDCLIGAAALLTDERGGSLAPKIPNAWDFGQKDRPGR